MAVARLAVCVPDGEGIRREDTLYVVPFTQDADNPMIVVALDTTTRAGSVAILRAGEILTSRKGDADRTHGERLPNDILTVLTEVGRAPADVDLYAVCSGPGSFTGLRVGLATIQGLAMATGRPVVTIPTLEALAYAGWWSDKNSPAPVTPARVIPLMNAQRGELFAAVYLAKAQPPLLDGRGMTLEIAPFVGTPTAVVDRLASTLSRCSMGSVTCDISSCPTCRRWPQSSHVWRKAQSIRTALPLMRYDRCMYAGLTPSSRGSNVVWSRPGAHLVTSLETPVPV